MTELKFDDALVALFRPVLVQALREQAPYLRGVAVLFDYASPLDQAQGLKWGLVQGIDAEVPVHLVGMQHVCLRLLEQLQGETVRRTEAIQAELTRRTGELVQARAVDGKGAAEGAAG